MKILNYSKTVFSNLIEDLNASQVNYAIIGDYAHLPEFVDHDVDMWTDDVEKVRETLFRVLSRLTYKVIIDNRTANGCNIAFYRRDGETITMMKLDVMIDTSYKSIITLVDDDMISTHRMLYHNFFVTRPDIESVMHFLYPMFEWGKIKKESYKIDILKYYKSPVFDKVFTCLWGKETSSRILSLIAQEDWNRISNLMGSLKQRAILRSILKPLTYKNIIRATYHTLYRYIVPSGKCLAFCGLDGAGKTTIIDELNDMFVNLLKSKKVYEGYWRPYVLPEIRELFGNKNSKDGIDVKAQKGKTVKEPERQPKGILSSLFKFAYYWLDYMLAPIKYGNIRSRGGMVLFDRHYVDMVVHPKRFEMKVPRGLMLFLYHFIPKADYTFFLYCTPEEIYERKKEFSKKEIMIQTNDYNVVGKNIKNFIPIHTNTSIAEETDEILSHIVKR